MYGQRRNGPSFVGEREMLLARTDARGLNFVSRHELADSFSCEIVPSALADVWLIHRALLESNCLLRDVPERAAWWWDVREGFL